MKSDRVLLTDWHSDNSTGYTDIPWPLVHAVIGEDMIQWVNSCEHTQVQLVLEKTKALTTSQHRLYAEFYTSVARKEFALRFAK